MVRREAVILISLTVISVVTFTHGFLEMIPGRGSVEYFNEKYIQSATLNVRKTGRGGIYVSNIDFTINTTLSNNMTVHLLSYELLHNEYRRSLMEFHMKFCNLLDHEPFIGFVARKAGLRCPLLPNAYHLRNLTLALPEIENMKWVFPFEKAKFRVFFQLSTTNETIAIANMTMTIRQVQKKTKTKLW